MEVVENAVTTITVSNTQIDQLTSGFVYNGDFPFNTQPSPLVSTVHDSNSTGNFIMVRTTLYIPMQSKTPSANPTAIAINAVVDSSDNKKINISIDYNLKEPFASNSYFVYYVDFQLTGKNITNYNKIDVKVINEDPETSRGTVTVIGTK